MKYRYDEECEDELHEELVDNEGVERALNDIIFIKQLVSWESDQWNVVMCTEVLMLRNLDCGMLRHI